jgi:hypothetical protein
MRRLQIAEAIESHPRWRLLAAYGPPDKHSSALATFTPVSTRSLNCKGRSPDASSVPALAISPVICRLVSLRIVLYRRLRVFTALTDGGNR